MKKLFALVLVLTLALTGCAAPAPSEETTEVVLTTEAVVVETTEALTTAPDPSDVSEEKTIALDPTQQYGTPEIGYVFLPDEEIIEVDEAITEDPYLKTWTNANNDWEVSLSLYNLDIEEIRALLEPKRTVKALHEMDNMPFKAYFCYTEDLDMILIAERVDGHLAYLSMSMNSSEYEDVAALIFDNFLLSIQKTYGE